jgi:hypothetical protein
VPLLAILAAITNHTTIHPHNSIGNGSGSLKQGLQ